MKKGLTTRQGRFVEAYTGNATAAACEAGYSPKTARSAGQRLLTNVDIQKAIRAREMKNMEGMIAGRQQRQRFWTDTMNNDGHTMRDRLRASELLGRSEGDFMDKLDHTSSDGTMSPRPAFEGVDIDTLAKIAKGEK